MSDWSINATPGGCPCKGDCPDRRADPNCHATCGRYLEWDRMNRENGRRQKLKSGSYSYVPNYSKGGN